MEFRYHDIEKDVLIIDVDGGLNRQTAAEFVDQIRSMIDAGMRHIIVDCSGLDYISSYGMGVLLRLHTSMHKHGGTVKICGLHGIVAQALTLTRLDRVFDIHPDLNRALLSFRKEAAGSDLEAGAGPEGSPGDDPSTSGA